MDGLFKVRLNDAVPYDLSPEFEAIPLLRHDQVTGEVPPAAAQRTGIPDSAPNFPRIKTEPVDNKLSSPNTPLLIDLGVDSESDDSFEIKVEKKEDDTPEAKPDRNEFYDWEMVPTSYTEDLKTGVTFKGDSAGYIEAHKMINNMLTQNNSKFIINDREMTVKINGKNKPLKVDVKTIKGAVGKVNLKFYNVNSKGIATIMISKVSAGTILHVKALAFKIIKYLIDGILDGELVENDLKAYRLDTNKEKNADRLVCKVCQKTFKLPNGLKIHYTKFHAINQCETCKEIFSSISDLGIHRKLCKVNVSKNKTELDKGSFVFKCDLCTFKSSTEHDIQKHTKEVHNSPSTSPSPKKLIQQKINVVEEMEVDDQNDLKEDSHASKKREKREKRDKKLQKKQQKKIELEKRMEEKMKKSEKKVIKEQKKESKLKLKTYLREIPANCKGIVGEDHILYPVKGDGACATRCLAAWIFQDQSLGPYIGRDLNTHFANNWDYWKNKFEIPFIREVGNGRQIICKNEKELLDFLLNSEEGAYLWRGHEDFSVLSSTYQCNIKIITISGQNDPNPRVNIIEPNPEVKVINKYPQGYIPDMVLLHEEDLHYNLVIPKNSRLATDGGLDYQRNELAKDSFVEVKANNKNEKLTDDGLNLLKEKICELEAKCETLESENKHLKELLHNKINFKDQLDIDEDAEVLLKYKKSGSKRLSPQVPNENKRKLIESPKVKIDRKKTKTELTCNKCDYKCESEVDLNSHEKTHDVRKKCDQCEAMFSTKPQLDDHVTKNHHKEASVERLNDYKCMSCFLQFESSLQLKKHVERTLHTPCEYKEKCFTCDKMFSSYWQLMKHRKSEHPSTKTCRYFQLKQCKFDEDSCWYKHEIISQSQVERTLIESTCNECDTNFKGKNELMMHKKITHEKKVQKCRKFQQGNCVFDKNRCWFSHDMIPKNDEIEQVFCEDKEKTPPDQIQNIYAIINQLSNQVAQMMKNPAILTQ